jgi:hypothetical protein
MASQKGGAIRKKRRRKKLSVGRFSDRDRCWSDENSVNALATKNRCTP